MKSWITYTAALFLGMAATLLFGDYALTGTILSGLSTFAVNIGILLFIPLAFISFSAGIASLRKDSLSGKAISSEIAWSIATSIILPLTAVLLFNVHPASFPVSSTAGEEAFGNAFITSHFSMALTSLATHNPYYTLATISTFILPIVILSWIFGYSLKPSADVVKPAYMTMNSFSEVMFRISRTYTVYGNILVFITSADFFTAIYQEKTIFTAPDFLVTFILIALFLTLVIMPLLYAIMTGGRRNPYKALFASIPSSIAGLTSGSVLFAAPVTESISRHNLGVQKRVAAVSTPLSVIINRGGSAAMGAITVLSLLYAVNGQLPSLSSCAIIALLSSLSSYAASVAGTYEAMFMTYMILALTNIELFGAEMTVLGLLPIVNGLGVMLDCQLSVLASAIFGKAIETDVDAPYKDMI